MQQVELQGPKLSVSAVGFGCGGLMRSPSRNERTEAAKKRLAILGDCSTPAKPEHASRWWIPAAWHRVASGDV